jgi:ATP/maltotriose-dependent transcriptional regulator MalT/two-component SAPR family response regulator
MPKPNFFLRTKLLPPRAVVELLSRPRLTEKLQFNLNSPITMVAADAGCGKTTLIADFIRSQTRESVWYQLDHTDADPFVFLGYIAQGIKNFAPDFGETILPYLSEATDDLLLHPERAVDLLLNEILETIEQPFILVLDDYHHIGRDTIVHQLVDRLLQYSSDMLHLIITTRDLPPLAIMRRRTQSRALIITREDLLFNDEEVRELFRTTLNVELKKEEIAEYRERTQGWITALQLIKQVAEQEIYAHKETPKLDLHEMLRQSEKDIFDYFAEEVFSREPDEIQNLLLHLSLLESLPLDVCSRLFPKERCAAVLPELLQKNVFLTVAGDGNIAEEYRLHPLFKDFLQRRLRSEIGLTELNKEKTRIAEFFIKDNQLEKALPFFLESENFETAAKIIAERGAEWLSSGAITTLDRFADQIPLEYLEKFPRALLHKAEIARLQGDLNKSSNILNRAVKLLHRANDKIGEAEALHSLASLARRKGKCGEAFEFLESAEKLVGEDTETYIKCANTRGLCLIAQGAWTNAEQQFRFALELAEKNSNEQFIRIVTHNLALPPGFRGDFGESLRWLKRIFRDGNMDKQLPQEAIGHLNVARLHLYRGEFEEAEKHLENSLELCQLYNLKSLRGEIFETYGNFYRETGDIPHASEFYERAGKAYEDAGINISTRDLDEERAKFYFQRGDLIKARGIFENLIEARKNLNNEIGLVRAKLHLCEVKLSLGETENLATEAQTVVNFCHDQTLYHDEAMASLLLANIHFHDKNRKEMLPNLQRTLDLTARFDYEHWLRGEIRKNPDLFKDGDIIEKLPLDLRESIAEAKPQVKTAYVPIIEKTESVTDLTIKVLGHIDIYRDQTKPFAADAWTTRRARDIFCHIATNPHRRVSKDLLIEEFWKDEDLSAIEKNFHPTISHIRKALNSRQTFKQNFIVFRDGAYQLNTELSYSIDTEEFENFIAEAEKAKKVSDTEKFLENLESAHELYRGEFMSGIYEDWAEEKRNYFTEQFLRVLNALAKIAFKGKKWSNASKYTSEILQIDPFREDAHRLLMKTFAAQGKRAQVLEHFENLKENLRKELGITPSLETKRTFEELSK